MAPIHLRPTPRKLIPLVPLPPQLIVFNVFASPLANVPTRPRKDDIEKLSRGESTRGKIGNRGVGHRLTQKERILFEAAKRNGFLKIPVTGIRKNVINIYKLWCQASARPFITK